MTYSRNGSVLKEGELMKRENLANTLEMISNEGPDIFYKGKLAKTIVRNLKKAGAIINLKDFNNYNAIIRKPLEGFYRGRKVITAGIPARYNFITIIIISGAIALEILGILEHFNMNENTFDNTHILIEAFKHGYSSRSLLGDPIYPVSV